MKSVSGGGGELEGAEYQLRWESFRLSRNEEEYA